MSEEEKLCCQSNKRRDKKTKRTGIVVLRYLQKPKKIMIKKDEPWWFGEGES